MKWRIASPENLAKFLSQELSTSGKAVRKMLETGFCKVNGKVERFGSTSLKKGDLVEVANIEIAPSKISFKTLYEDEAIKIVDKPKGFVCDPASASKAFHGRLFLVHRLDKDTTGALLLAKSKAIKEELIALFRERKVGKKYLALVDGHPKTNGGRIQSLLEKKRVYEGQTIWGSGSKGEEAITDWKVLAKGKLSALLLVEPITGRTHQIRVHLAEMGHPILVDRQYAKHFRSPFFAARYLLHARELSFVFRGKKIEAVAELPQDFEEALTSLEYGTAWLASLQGPA